MENERKTDRVEGFTLIELLIVVAIIGILASIAVPNFLNAMSRAKIARNQADMRAVVNAIEAYRIDLNRVPFPSGPFGGTIPANSPNTFWFETKLSNQLTTPVAYMNALPSDPYHPVHSESENTVYHYMTRPYARIAAGSDTQYDAYCETVGFPTGSTQYILLGHGPDGDHDDPLEGFPARYAATNGLTSNGDILYYGPGGGFGD